MTLDLPARGQHKFKQDYQSTLRSYGVSVSEAATSAMISAFSDSLVIPWLTMPLDALLSGRLSASSGLSSFSVFSLWRRSDVFGAMDVR
jgi:hypothetical protein